MIINFGKALRNNFTVKLFNKFLSLKSSSNDVREFDFNTNNLVNDLHFLIQVLEYKVRKLLFQLIEKYLYFDKFK